MDRRKVFGVICCRAAQLEISASARTAYQNLSLYRVTPDYPANTPCTPEPRAASANTLLTQHYRASPGYDSNAAMDPYMNHLGPSSGGHKGNLIDLWATSHVFLPGHRARLEIASSNFPRFGRNLNTGEDQATGSRRQTAAQTILQESSRINAADHWLRKRMARVPRILILFLPLRGPRPSHSSAASTAAENRATIPTDLLVGSPEPAQLNRRRKNWRDLRGAFLVSVSFGFGLELLPVGNERLLTPALDAQFVAVTPGSARR
jgi:hypothetical protein